MQADDERTLEALVCVRTARLISFTASPLSVGPGNQSTTIAWNVATPGGPCRNLEITLNGSVVPASGQQTFTQNDHATYLLRARLLTATRVLGRIVVPFDFSHCSEITLNEYLIRQVTTFFIAETVAAYAAVTLRSDPTIEVAESGISVGIRARVALPNFPDADVDVDAVVAPSAQDGEAVFRYRSFAVDIDLPWWVTALTAGASKVLEEVVEDMVEAKLKPMLLAKLSQTVTELTAAFQDLEITNIRAEFEGIRVTLCETEIEAELKLPDVGVTAPLLMER